MITFLLVPLLILVAIGCIAIGYLAAYGQRRGDYHRELQRLRRKRGK